MFPTPPAEAELALLAQDCSRETLERGLLWAEAAAASVRVEVHREVTTAMAAIRAGKFRHDPWSNGGSVLDAWKHRESFLRGALAARQHTEATWALLRDPLIVYLRDLVAHVGIATPEAARLIEAINDAPPTRHTAAIQYAIDHGPTPAIREAAQALRDEVAAWGSR